MDIYSVSWNHRNGFLVHGERAIRVEMAELNPSKLPLLIFDQCSKHKKSHIPGISADQCHTRRFFLL